MSPACDERRSTISVDGRRIGPDHPPYVIAEMSANHNGSLERAFAIMTAAKEAGADAVKLQTYRPDTITLDHDGPGFRIEDGLWAGRRLYELYEEAQTPWDWHEPLFAKGRELGITVFSSPFDPTAVELLASLGAPAYKIASCEIVDLPLIRRTAACGRPLIISCGMADEEEIEDAVAAARDAGCQDLALLHCVSGYPTPIEQANLRTIVDMRERFGTPIGLSDHSMGVAAASAAVALGASIIEKHFTLSRDDGGPDAAFSLEPAELARLTQQCRDVWQALGEPSYGVQPSEAGTRRFRRSLYAVTTITKGEVFTLDNVRSIRPADGLPPKHLPDILGKMAAKSIAKGTPLSWDLVADEG